MVLVNLRELRQLRLITWQRLTFLQLDASWCEIIDSLGHLKGLLPSELLFRHLSVKITIFSIILWQAIWQLAKALLVWLHCLIIVKRRSTWCLLWDWSHARDRRRAATTAIDVVIDCQINCNLLRKVLTGQWLHSYVLIGHCLLLSDEPVSWDIARRVLRSHETKAF